MADGADRIAEHGLRTGPLLERFVDEPRVRRLFTALSAVLWFYLVQQLLWPAPVGVLVQGMVIGGLTSLIAFGIALIYRANRIINFAQGDLGGAPAALAVLLIVGPRLPYAAAMTIGLLAAVVLGGIVEFVVIRRFFKAPRLILTVATIGLAQLLSGVEIVLPRAFKLTVPPQSFPSPFNFSFSIHPIVFRGNDIIAMLAVPAAIVGLLAFFRYTNVGIAVRASAESADRAALLGVPVKRIQTIVWILATVLSTAAMLLRAGVLGLPIGSVLGPGILLRALAAAVIGRMEKLHTIFVAAVGLGVIEQSVVWHTGKGLLADPILFVVILAALLLQRRGSVSRAQDHEASTWQAAREVRPVPRELARLPEVYWGLRAVSCAVAAVLIALPFLLSDSRINLAGAVLVLATVGISLVVLTGWAGQVSLGQMAFVGIGAAIGGALTNRLGWDLLLATAAAGVVGAVVALLIGLPALRVRGLFLAVTTLAFSLATSSYFLSSEFFPWLPTDRIERRPLLGRIWIDTEARFYYMALAGLAFGVWTLRGIRRSRTGRVLIAVRENERAAQAAGVNLTRAKLTAFAASGFIAAYAGSLFIHHQQSLVVSSFAPERSLQVFTTVVIGGLGSVPGALLGAAYVRGIAWFLPSSLQFLSLLSSGLGLLVILMIVPGGLGSLLYAARDGGLRFIARRRGLVVPSLLADVGEAAPEELVATAEVPAVAGSGEKLLRVSGLNVRYGGTQVLFGVDFDIAEGEIVALLGTNGAGKSTLLNAVSGVVSSFGGSVMFDGRDITNAPAHRVVARGVLQVPGGRGVFGSLTVEENLRIAGWLYRRDPVHVNEAIDEVLGYFPVLRERWSLPAGNLSGGEQQMLTLGQAFIARPRLLMIDELSLGLAPVVVERLLEIIKAIHDRGTTIVLVEQSVNVALTVAQTAYFMEKGQIRFHGATRELLQRPDILRSVFLEGAASIGTAGARTNGSKRSKHPIRAASRPAQTQRVLEVSGLRKAFGGITAVDDASFVLHEGEILGLIGPNGAGKTTIFDLISGFLRPDTGNVVLAGEDITDAPPDIRSRIGLGRSFQDARLFPALTVADTVALYLERHVEVKDPLAAALNLPTVADSEAAVSRRVNELIELMGLTAFRDKFLSELSTGSRRIVDLACILAHEPKVVLLDEPASGIAQRETEALGPLLLRIRDATGASLLVIEHDMPLIGLISDRIVALDLGRVIAGGTPDEIVHHPAVVASYLGSSEQVVARSSKAGKSRKRQQTGRSVTR